MKLRIDDEGRMKLPGELLERWGIVGARSVEASVQKGRLVLEPLPPDGDPFAEATRQFIAQLPNPPAGGFSPGGHDGAYWSSQLPAELAWTAPQLVA